MVLVKQSREIIVMALLMVLVGLSGCAGTGGPTQYTYEMPDTPDRAEARRALSDVLSILESNPEQARKQLQEIRDRYPAEATGLLGTVAALQDDMDRAEELWLRSLELKPDQPHVLYNLASLYISRGENLSPARRFLERAMELDPDNQQRYRKKLERIKSEA